MTRHIADKQKAATGARLRRFLQVERTHRDEGDHPAARALTRRPRKGSAPSGSLARLKQYLRIERGHDA